VKTGDVQRKVAAWPRRSGTSRIQQQSADSGADWPRLGRWNGPARLHPARYTSRGWPRWRPAGETIIEMADGAAVGGVAAAALLAAKGRLIMTDFASNGRGERRRVARWASQIGLPRDGREADGLDDDRWNGVLAVGLHADGRPRGRVRETGGAAAPGFGAAELLVGARPQNNRVPRCRAGSWLSAVTLPRPNVGRRGSSHGARRGSRSRPPALGFGRTQIEGVRHDMAFEDFEPSSGRYTNEIAGAIAS